MNEKIVALAVDKVQTFLTEVIHSHVQEKQTEDATLKEIISSSEQISEEFFRSIEEVFSGVEKKILLKCSGVYIFRCSMPGVELEERLNDLFREYYLNSQGQKLLRWHYFSSDGLDNLAAIKKAKECLKQAENQGEIIEKNQEFLFSFHPVIERKGHYERSQELFPAFSEDINALKRKDAGKGDEGKRFRIAVIKADLDGMGEMFKNIDQYDMYKTISQSLNEHISLVGLHTAASNCIPANRTSEKKGWLFPLYIAGDDIFFAVAVEDLVFGIDVCKKLIENVNQKIEKKNAGKRLNISIGVAITFNKEPIRYYMEMVETQLKNAKLTKVPKEYSDKFVMKISIGDLTFFDVNTEEEENSWSQNLSLWGNFMTDLRLLNDIRENDRYKELLGTPNFFYTLLEDITNEEVRQNDVVYINHILYHLLPKYLEGSDEKLRGMESSLNYSLIKQLYGENEKKEEEIVICEDTKQRFERYLRLMLLFSDVRFSIEGKEGQKRKEYKEEEVSPYLFNKPRTYLYENCLKKTAPELTDIFVQQSSTGKNKRYRCLHLETSMFYRMRNIESIPIEKAANMIELRNPSTEGEKQKIEEVNKKSEQEEKLSNRQYFEKDKFLETAEREEMWTAEWIDSLMLFYQYHELVKKSGQMKKKRKGIQNGKQYKNKSKNSLKHGNRRDTKAVRNRGY